MKLKTIKFKLNILVTRYASLIKNTLFYSLLPLITLYHRIIFGFKQTKLYKLVQEKIREYEPTYVLIKLVLKAVRDFIKIVLVDVVKPYVLTRVSNTRALIILYRNKARNYITLSTPKVIQYLINLPKYLINFFTSHVYKFISLNIKKVYCLVTTLFPFLISIETSSLYKSIKLWYIIQYHIFIFLKLVTSLNTIISFIKFIYKHRKNKLKVLIKASTVNFRTPFFKKVIFKKYFNKSHVYPQFTFKDLKKVYYVYNTLSGTPLFHYNNFFYKPEQHIIFFENYFFYKFLVTNPIFINNYLRNGGPYKLSFEKTIILTLTREYSYFTLLTFAASTNLLLSLVNNKVELGLKKSLKNPNFNSNLYLLDQLTNRRATQWIHLYESYLTSFLKNTSHFPQLKKFWDKKIKFQFSHKLFNTYKMLTDISNYYPVKVNSVFKEFMKLYWPTRFNPNNFYKFHDLLSNDNYIIMFLRKNKIFNKSRYSRNRQLYRTGVYLCLYINVIFVYFYIFSFYRFAFVFSYLWFGIGLFIITMTLGRAMKYRFYNPVMFLSEFDHFKTWLGHLLVELLVLVKNGLWWMYEFFATKAFWYNYLTFKWPLKRILKKKNARLLNKDEEARLLEKIRKYFVGDQEYIHRLSSQLPHSFIVFWERIRPDIFQIHISPDRRQKTPTKTRKKINKLCTKYRIFWEFYTH